MLITDFADKKVSDYLNTGKYKKVLLIMNHGLGDSLMFYSNCYKTLVEAYPDIEFYYDTHIGQEDLFGYIDKAPEHYDIAFKFSFPESSWNSIDLTKGENCTICEIGLEPTPECYNIDKKFSSPLVGIHLNSTCYPSLNVPEEFASRLWNQIIINDFIPIDTHMRHSFDNKRSVIYPFEQCRRIDNIPATLPKLMGLIGVCAGFAGVSSGNFFCALSSLPPEKILYIGSGFPARKLTRLPVHEINWREGYNEEVVQAWLDCLKG